MSYFIWVPIAIIFQFIGAYFSNRLNISKDNKWLVLQYFWTLLPLWSIVCKYSSNVLFDAVLYDLIILITYSFSLIILTKAPLSVTNYIGLAIIFLGLVLFKK